MTLRHAVRLDAPAIAEVLKSAWHASYDGIMGVEKATETGQLAYFPDYIRAWIGHAATWRRRASYIIAEIDGQIAGLLQGVVENQHEAIIYALYVDPDWQSRGIGTALLDAFTQEHPRVTSFRLEVLKANTGAIDFYKRRGFEAFGETPNALMTEGVPSIYMDTTIPVRPGRPWSFLEWVPWSWKPRPPLRHFTFSARASPWAGDSAPVGSARDDAGAGQGDAGTPVY